MKIAHRCRGIPVNSTEGRQLGRVARADVRRQRAAVASGPPGERASPLFAASDVWVSTSPLVAMRHPKSHDFQRDENEVRRSDPDGRHSLRPEGATQRTRTSWYLARVWCRRILRRADRKPGRCVCKIASFYSKKLNDDGGRRATGMFPTQFGRRVTGLVCLGYTARMFMLKLKR